MPKGEIIEVNGVRYEAVEDDPFALVMGEFGKWRVCDLCDYKKDHKEGCDAFCCEMGLYNCHFKRLESCK